MYLTHWKCILLFQKCIGSNNSYEWKCQWENVVSEIDLVWFTLMMTYDFRSYISLVLLLYLLLQSGVCSLTNNLWLSSDTGYRETDFNQNITHVITCLMFISDSLNNLSPVKFDLLTSKPSLQHWLKIRSRWLNIFYTIIIFSHTLLFSRMLHCRAVQSIVLIELILSIYCTIYSVTKLALTSLE